ncbi:UNVERIFIED_CONTAM: hypothetical protein K2H54_038356 [Gekko kuhli]
MPTMKHFTQSFTKGLWGEFWGIWLSGLPLKSSILYCFATHQGKHTTIDFLRINYKAKLLKQYLYITNCQCEIPATVQLSGQKGSWLESKTMPKVTPQSNQVPPTNKNSRA